MPTPLQPPRDASPHILDSAGLYVERLSDEDRAAFEVSSGDLDLTGEIRLMRVVLSRLVADIPANKSVIPAVFNALLRANSIQTARSGAVNDAEASLLDAADRVLEEM